MHVVNFIKNCLAFGIIGAAIALPASLVWNYFRPWAEGIDLIKQTHPEQLFIPLSGSSRSIKHNDTWMEEYRSRTYLLLPENIQVTLRKEKDKEIQYSEHTGGLAPFATLIITIYTLFFWLGLTKFREKTK